MPASIPVLKAPVVFREEGFHAGCRVVRSGCIGKRERYPTAEFSVPGNWRCFELRECNWRPLYRENSVTPIRYTESVLMFPGNVEMPEGVGMPGTDAYMLGPYRDAVAVTVMPYEQK